MIRRLTLPLALLLLMLPAVARAQSGSPPIERPASGLPELSHPTDLITTQRGTLPIILSAPHGGQCRVPGSADRTKGVTVRDDMTSEIALLVAQRITAKLGEKPSFVIAQFSRHDVDPNRAPDSGEAFENPAAKAQYEAFHSALRSLVDEARTNETRTGHPGAILIDIHGQKREPDAIIRGTRDGKTVTSLLARRGEAALTGPDSIFGRLKTAGYTLFPPLNASPAEPDAKHALDEKFFDGGYIIAHYGSQNADGIDAIQIELGQMRTTDTLKLSRDLGDAIAAFYRAHLAPKSPPFAPKDASDRDKHPSEKP